MQAYGWSTIVGSSTGQKSVAAYWPMYNDQEGRSKTLKNYRDEKTSNRSLGFFMRNRVFPVATYIEEPTVVHLYSGTYTQFNSRGIERFSLLGTTFLVESITYRRRTLNAYSYEPKLVTDITNDYNGYWAIWKKIVGYSDTLKVPYTSASLDAMTAEFIPRLGPFPFTPDKVTQYARGLPGMSCPESYLYPASPSSVRAMLYNDYNWLTISGNLSTRDRDRAAQAAYVAAAQGIPQVTSNGVANILEAASMLSSLLLGDFKKSTNFVGDAWLAYRYSYCTTKMDIEEYQSYVQRIIDLTDLTAPPSYRCHGTYVDQDGWKYHCVMRVKTGDSLPSDLRDTVRDFGLQLSAASAWDMIPYSFIVDWFLPVSETLSSYESHMRSQHLPILECWMSVTSPKGDQYLRFPYKWKNVIPIVEQRNVSDRTLWMRIADSIALFL